MLKVGGGGGVRLTGLSRLRVTIFSSRLLGLRWLEIVYATFFSQENNLHLFVLLLPLW